ncbi:uncharacterized protein LOC111531374 isoform X1 [Piliocolobus tephrosceles]|uniref:uncharacterized protein LOC111531374 isoform X1 n=1 Tax=Piliocolobus tephrosceles TaxID=591936 RepID=UPI000C298A2B|nr:uncharacterized protein LOC111531374 isoform X1 [Piliocolobus tephrosceles]
MTEGNWQEATSMDIPTMTKTGDPAPPDPPKPKPNPNPNRPGFTGDPQHRLIPQTKARSKPQPAWFHCDSHFTLLSVSVSEAPWDRPDWMEAQWHCWPELKC